MLTTKQTRGSMIQEGFTALALKNWPLASSMASTHPFPISGPWCSLLLNTNSAYALHPQAFQGSREKIHVKTSPRIKGDVRYYHRYKLYSEKVEIIILVWPAA